MEIKRTETDSKGVFKAMEGLEELGYLTFSKAGKDKIIIDHTEVKSSQKGSGLGNDLVKAAVIYAREEGKKILPLCPFAKSVFLKNKDIQDVMV